MPSQKKSWVEVPKYERSGTARVPHGKSNSSKPGSPSPSPARHSHAQESLFGEWLTQQMPLEVAFSDGSRLYGTLTDFDTYAITIASDGYPTLVFKSAVRSIRSIPNGGDMSGRA